MSRGCRQEQGPRGDRTVPQIRKEDGRGGFPRSPARPHPEIELRLVELRGDSVARADRLDLERRTERRDSDVLNRERIDEPRAE